MTRGEIELALEAVDDSLVVTELSGESSFLNVLLLLLVAVGMLTRRDFDLVVGLVATLGSRGVFPRTTYW